MLIRAWVAGLLALPAFAGPTVAVLGIAGTDVPEEVAQTLTQELRERFRQGGYALAPAKDLVEIELIFCEGARTHACLARAGRSLGAEKVVAGTLRGGKPATLSVELIDVATGNPERGVKDQSIADVTVARMRETGVWVFSQLTGTPMPAPAAPKAGAAGRVRIRHVNELGGSYRMIEAHYALDGRTIFSRTDEAGLPGGGSFPVIEETLAPGRHVIVGIEVYRGESTLFPYMRELRVTLMPSYEFTVPGGQDVEVELVSAQAGGLLTPWEDGVDTTLRALTAQGTPLAIK